MFGLVISTHAIENTNETNESNLAVSLSGATKSGLEFDELSSSAMLGSLGAGFLVINVLRRRKHIYRVQ